MYVLKCAVHEYNYAYSDQLIMNAVSYLLCIVLKTRHAHINVDISVSLMLSQLKLCILYQCVS